MKKRKEITPKKDRSVSFTLFLTISILVHMLLVGSLGGGGGNGSGGGSAEQETNASAFIPKPIENIEVTLADIKIDGEEKKKKSKNKKHKRSGKEEEYGGIGIMTYGSIVTNVPEYYPGYKAGIRYGDTIISPEVGTIKGEPGTIVAVTVKHLDGNVETFMIVRELIRVEIINDLNQKK